MPEVRYDPDIGMMGFDVAVTLQRPGYSVKERKEGGEVGSEHRIGPEEAKEFVEERFGVEVV